jgi:hypothetical protein
MSHRESNIEQRRVCAVCGREIEWRKKWARDWENVKYCSDACRGRRQDATRDPLQQAMVELLRQRAQGATVCPSEVARLVAGDEWRGRMEDVRAAARLLEAQGLVEITQAGRVVDPSTARGPVRVRATRALLTPDTTTVERTSHSARRGANNPKRP